MIRDFLDLVRAAIRPLVLTENDRRRIYEVRSLRVDVQLLEEEKQALEQELRKARKAHGARHRPLGFLWYGS